MYNRLKAYKVRYNILLNKQFGFRVDHSTEHAVFELIYNISDLINNKSYFPGIFINLLKAFDTVDDQILLKELQHYGIKGKNLPWFESYLTGRKQYFNFKINENNRKTELLEIICQVLQESVLGQLFKTTF